MTRSAFDNGITKSLVEAARIMLSEGASKPDKNKRVEDDDIPTIFHDNGDKEWRKRGKPHRDGDKPAIVRDNGDKEWHQHGKLHRDGDKPAIVHVDGRKEWRQHGVRHRDGDKHAVEYPSGGKEWHQHGRLHREGDKPSVVHADGGKEWHQHGQRHRDGDKPATEHPDGQKSWFKNGEIHRDGDKPAVVHTSSQSWYKHGGFHRDGDKPAIVGTNGDKEWYKHGVRHRDGDKPAIDNVKGHKEWHKHGKRHREDGPAVIWSNGNKDWYRNGDSVRPEKQTKLGEGYQKSDSLLEAARIMSIKSASQLDENKKVEDAKQKLSKIIEKDRTKKYAERRAKITDVHNHFQKEAPKLLKDHGYTKLHSTNGHTVYHKPHDSGHSTMVRISHNHNEKEYNSYGSKFGVHSTAGHNTLNGHNYEVKSNLSKEENCVHMMHSFRDRLVNHDIDHKRDRIMEEVENNEEFTVEDFENMTNEEREEFLNQKLNEIEKDSYITHKKSGAVGKVANVSGDRSSVDIEWNDKKSKHHPSQPMNRVKKFK